MLMLVIGATQLSALPQLPETRQSKSVKITGKVTDENNEPLEFVSIKIAGTMALKPSGMQLIISLNFIERRIRK